VQCDDGGAKRTSAVRSANNGGAYPSSCGPVRQSASVVGIAIRFVGE